MIRIAVIVEGYTELDFVQRILYKHLAYCEVRGICLEGGRISVERVKDRIKRLIVNYDFVTTMVDFYGFNNSQGKTVDDIERDIKSSVSNHNHKIIPYVQKYEFEALLFSNKNAIAECLEFNTSKKEKLEAISNPPEEINHNMPPSKYLQRIHREYQKRLDGITIIEKIGLPKIMEKCPRFAQWIRELENAVGNPPQSSGHIRQ